MAKTSGLGQLFLVGGYDISGDVGSLSNVHGGPALLEATGIDKYAHERIAGLMDGSLDFVAYFNATGEHPVLSALPTTDVEVMWLMGQTLGLPAAFIRAVQIGYDGTRGTDGSLTFAVHCDSGQAGAGLEWGDLLTAGLRTDTAATNGASIDGVTASTTGWAAHLQVTAFTGTDVVVTIQDSANDSTWANVTGGVFTSVTAAASKQRITGASGATLRRYVRAVTTTVGGVTSATFAVAISRHPSGAAA